MAAMQPFTLVELGGNAPSGNFGNFRCSEVYILVICEAYKQAHRAFLRRGLSGGLIIIVAC